MGLYTTQAKHLHNKLRRNFSISPPFKYEPGKQIYSNIYGTEYQSTNTIVPNSYDTYVPCAVCYMPTRTTLCMMLSKWLDH